MVHSKPHIMQPFDLHPEFYNQPIVLTKEEVLNPLSVIEEFFNDVNLIEIRAYLYKLLEVALTKPNDLFAEAYERDTILCLCKQLEKVVEAAWVVNKKGSLNPKKSIY